MFTYNAINIEESVELKAKPWVIFVSAKNTYMKFDYMRLSHMRVKWNEICYIPICYQVFAGWEDLVLIIHIRNLRNVKIVVQERVFVC